jgi:flagellar hook assembly protein FlgD
VSLSVYNIQGQLIEVLMSGNMNAGYHSMEWNAERYPSGLYFYSLSVGNETFKKKMILLK